MQGVLILCYRKKSVRGKDDASLHCNGEEPRGLSTVDRRNSKPFVLPENLNNDDGYDTIILSDFSYMYGGKEYSGSVHVACSEGDETTRKDIVSTSIKTEGDSVDTSDDTCYLHAVNEEGSELDVKERNLIESIDCILPSQCQTVQTVHDSDYLIPVKLI